MLTAALHYLYPHYLIIQMFAHTRLLSADSLTQLITSTGIHDWATLINHIRTLPYGRNANRTDLALVITERKGTCSSKHALLKQIADLNSIHNVSLLLGIYKMNEHNTPGIGNTLAVNNLPYIPEAHCYLKINDERVDLTSANASFGKIENDILLETEIAPEQVADFKIDWHQAYIKNWLTESGLRISFDEVWQIRERCIQSLSGTR